MHEIAAANQSCPSSDELDVARESGAEKLHLVGQYIVIGQVEEFILVGYEGNCQQLHIGFFWQPVGLAVIAATAGSNDVGPGILATSR